jgi:TetR/AcrR family transcriptional repressor of nem operon
MARHRGFDDDTVVDRAMEEFWSHGYANTSPAQLAEATGVAKGSLYNAFGSKRELFERALQRYDVVGVELTEELLSGPGSAQHCIRSFLRCLVDADVARAERRGCLAVNTAVEFAGRDPEMTRTVRAMQDHTTAVLAARLDQGRRDGDVSADLDPQATARFLMNTIVGLRVMAKTYDAPVLYDVIESALTVL